MHHTIDQITLSCPHNCRTQHKGSGRLAFVKALGSCHNLSIHNRRFRRWMLPCQSTNTDAVSGTSATDVVKGNGLCTWQGQDEFTYLEDRKDLTPLPLPPLNSPKRVVLVRHGQSTWNAEGRIQGSSNFAVLTAKGVAQAETTKQMLENEDFDVMFYSPLERAKRTAEIIWGQRDGPVTVLPSLREIDLYSFQGLLKNEGKQLYGDKFAAWQKQAATFVIDGQAPTRELWYRASLAWQSILCHPPSVDSILVVAHNAVNQALIHTAIGLPPTYFRRVLQSNAAVSVIDFQPTGNGAPRVTLDRLNQSPGPPFSASSAGRDARVRVVLVRHCSTLSSEAGLMLGVTDEQLSTLGEVHAIKTGEMLMDIKVDALLCSPLSRSSSTAECIAKLQVLAGHEPTTVKHMTELKNNDVGEWEGFPTMQLRGQQLPANAEPMSSAWDRTHQAWQQILSTASSSPTIVVVAHAFVNAALLCHALGLSQDSVSLFRTDPGSITLLDFPDGISGPAVIRCMNYTAHLGRWAVPITRDDLDMVCGIDGCF